MKLRQIAMGILLCLISIPCVQAQTYKKLWKQVEQAEEKSLPETVVKLTDVIYRKEVESIYEDSSSHSLYDIWDTAEWLHRKVA